ncbi:DUF1772 domain-containing protein [Xanthobacter nonsaccharivorans]|uniref:DUF1772 domain-containing protein n=1 Tax=Xanthobacter nonsaccharivorans TaxID=3119912 RepID=UPI00372D012A
MIEGYLALVAAAAFTGIAFYINAVEQPARLALGDAAALRQWVAAYRRGFILMAGLTVTGALFGAAAFGSEGDWHWLAGAVLLIANWPYTHIGVAPTNQRLLATAEAAAGGDTRRLIENWGQLHMVRTGLGALATLVFFWAAIT